MFFAIIGLVILVVKKKYNGLAIALTMAAISYICASWWCNFSCAFGYRSFIEYYPLLSIPLAWLLYKYFAGRKVLIAVLFMFLMLYINIRITHHYAIYGWNWCDKEWSWALYMESLKIVFINNFP